MKSLRVSAGVALLGVLAAATLPLSVLAGKAEKPRTKWGQTKEQLFVSVIVRDLVPDSVAVALTTQTDLSFRAKNSKGQDFALDLYLREDVKPETMKWEIGSRPDKWGTAVIISLNKVNEHRWDLLVMNPKAYKGIMEKDWTREDQKLEPEEEVPYLEDHSSVLVALTEKNLNKTRSKYDVVLANLRYPWCSKCNTQDQDFVKAAKLAKAKAKKDKAWKKVAWAVVDAREERVLARQFNASCDKDFYAGGCEIRVFAEPGEDGVHLKMPYEASKLLTDVEKFLRPSVELVKDNSELAALRAKNSTCFGRFQSADSPAFVAFRRIARQLRGVLVFAASFGESGDVELWSLPQNASFVFDGSLEDNDGKALPDWIRPRLIPLLQEYDYQLRETYENTGLPIAKVWVDDKDENPSFMKIVRHALRRVAKQFLGRIAFIEGKKSMYSYELRDYGLDQPEVYPAFGIASNISYNAVKYGLEVVPALAATAQEFWKDADKAIPKLVEFCEQVLAGSWPEAHESGAPQTNWTEGTVRHLVWRNFEEVRKPKRPLLLELYGKYRSDHEKKLTEVEHLAEVLAPFAESFTVASYDTGNNYLPEGDFKRDKYARESEWYWVKPADSGDSPSVTKLSKPAKDPPTKAIFEFVKKQSGLDIDIEQVVKKHADLMVEKPPPKSPDAAASFDSPPSPVAGEDFPADLGVDMQQAGREDL